MTSEPPPSSSPPSPRFRSKMRGYDTVEVDRTISDLLAEQKRLTEERASLQARLDALGESDLTAELTAVSKDTADILEAAQTGCRWDARSGGRRCGPLASRSNRGRFRLDRASRRRCRDDAPIRMGHRDRAARRCRCRGGGPAVRTGKGDGRSSGRVGAGGAPASRQCQERGGGIVSRARTTAEEALEEARRRHDEIGEQIRSSIEQAEGKVRALEERRAELMRRRRRRRPICKPLTTRSRHAASGSRWWISRSPARSAPANDSVSGLIPVQSASRGASERRQRGAASG